RNIRDRKALARYAGLTGAPDESGKKRRERGLAKAGNARVRRGMIELAWGHLVHQKASALTAWNSEANFRCPRLHPQHDEHRARAQTPHCVVATRDNWRDAGRSDAAPGRIRKLSCCGPSVLSMPSCS